ncbi:MAG: cadherin-like domain-containing protein, partial [Pirellulaceae bacterium]
DDTPVVGNQSATLAEGATLTLAGSHLSATDTETEDATLIFTLQSVPANGELKKDGTTLAAGGTFTQADVTSGKIRYTHDDSNTTSDHITFTVKDAAGNETETGDFAITITPVDDEAPVVDNRSATLAEGATLTLAASHLSATDTESEDATLIFTLQSAPANGELKKDGTTLAANGTFTQADVTSGKIRYTHDDSNTTGDRFTFTVKDRAGNETGTDTFAITITPVDDDTPVVGNPSATVAEGATLTLAGSHLSATDADTEDATLIFTVQSVPANGELKKDGTALAANDTFTQADVTSGKLSYTHDDGNTTSDIFTFTAKDPAGNETGTEIFAVTITPVSDDTPIVGNQTVTLAEGAALTLTGSHLSATDADSDDAALIFTLQSVPANGELKKDGTALAANGTFTQKDITDAKITYTHDDSNTTSDTFTFTVKDPAGNETKMETFSIAVTPVDDDTPTVVNKSATVSEGGPLTLVESNLSATDSDTDDATLVFTVKSVPLNGQLANDDAVLTVDDRFTPADIAAGAISYTHDGSNTTSDSFVFTVKDPAFNETVMETYSIEIDVDGTPPTADIVEIAPDPRHTDAGTVTIRFSEDVKGVDVTDFSLTRDDTLVDIDSLLVTLVTARHYTIDLSNVTGDAGDYVLSLEASDSGIEDLAGNRMIAGAADNWTTRIGWYNPSRPMDVVADGFIVPMDALRIINEVNSRVYIDSTGKLPPLRPANAPFLDVNGDGFSTSIDALIIVNYLDSPDAAEGEGLFWSRYFVATELAVETKLADSHSGDGSTELYPLAANPFPQTPFEREPRIARTSVDIHAGTADSNDLFEDALEDALNAIAEDVASCLRRLG